MIIGWVVVIFEFGFIILAFVGDHAHNKLSVYRFRLSYVHNKFG